LQRLYRENSSGGSVVERSPRERQVVDSTRPLHTKDVIKLLEEAKFLSAEHINICLTPFSLQN